MQMPIVPLRHRLKEALQIRKISQQELSEKTGIPKSSISQYLSGYASPRHDRVSLMAEALDVNEVWLLGYDVPMTRYNENIEEKKVKGVRIPVLGTVAAGIPIDVYEEYIDWEEVTPELAMQGDIVGLRIKGNSMAPRIVDGDIAIVRQQPDVDSGDLAVVIINGDEATLKQVQKTRDGITLIAFNPAEFAPRSYTYKEMEDIPIEIFGKVIEFRGKL